MNTHLDDLEYINLQLKALSNTIENIQVALSIEKNPSEKAICSFITLQHSVNNIRAEIDIKISDIVDL